MRYSTYNAIPHNPKSKKHPYETLEKSRFFSFFVLSENINTKLDGRNRVCYIDFIKITVHNERKTGER